ncbi:hydroxyethylthiazole kinase [Virgibacillus halophilus]|uniref:Hydroxyethylthiazole kinase n=1 Tax=Tigheibacillus halophilus TaxID=361280 RepID=A0ABU5C6H0_9BACI|nr:hydroxyethylthiazole kinase [Virgibacillus halophilus]
MDYIAKIRENSPFIFNITNEVATNFAANGLIAIGASPAMSHTPREAEEMARHADAVVLNLGTLTEDRAEAMLKAGKTANDAGVPVILDPIAAGATTFRTEVIAEILSTVKLAVIKANAGEIAVLGNVLKETKGPDSPIEKNDPNVAAAVAEKYKTIVIATGKTDVISDGSRRTLCDNGHPMLQNITASGCLLTSIVGAFASVTQDMYEAAVWATASYGIAAELAMKTAEGPGTFIPALLDQLYALDQEKVKGYQRIQEMEEERKVF